MCVSVGRSGPASAAARRARKEGRSNWMERGQRDRGRRETRSLYFKQPRTCCNHLETMARRSVRFAKRPGPDNSRDASSTTLRAIRLPSFSSSPTLGFLLFSFSPSGEFLLLAGDDPQTRTVTGVIARDQMLLSGRRYLGEGNFARSSKYFSSFLMRKGSWCKGR